MFHEYGQVAVDQAGTADLPHVGDVYAQALFDLIVVGDGIKGLSFAFLSSLAVAQVKESQVVIQSGNGGGYATVETAADEDDGKGHGRFLRADLVDGHLDPGSDQSRHSRQ